MVLLIPDAVRKIKAQGYAEGRSEGLAEGRAEGRREVRQCVEDALLEYRRREGIGLEDPLPVPVILNIIDDAFDRNDAGCCR